MAKADELVKKYTLEEHVENGLFIERHYQAAGEIFASRLNPDAEE